MTKSIFAVFLLFLNSQCAAAQGSPATAPYSVILDAGHGGRDAGVQIQGTAEKILSLDLARQIESQLSGNPTIKVILTRQDDYSLSFDERRRIANTNSPALFLSLHFGVHPALYFLPSTGELKSGVLIPLERAHEESLSQSIRFGGTLADALTSILPEIKLGSAEFPLVTLIGIRVPAILAELPFPKTDQALSPYATAIAEAIDRFVSGGKNPPGESPKNEIPPADSIGPAPDHD